jgi:hypothetical protein
MRTSDEDKLASIGIATGDFDKAAILNENVSGFDSLVHGHKTLRVSDPFVAMPIAAGHENLFRIAELKTNKHFVVSFLFL